MSEPAPKDERIFNRRLPDGSYVAHALRPGQVSPKRRLDVKAPRSAAKKRSLMAQFKTKFDSKRQDWETPAVLFDPLNNEFGFTLDVCATAENAKCKSYFTIADNGLAQVWKGICWMNPPFGEQGKWVHKAYQSSLEGATVVCLLPSRTNTNWWHDVCMKGEIRFIRGRPKFVGAEHGLPQPLSVVVFTPPNTACTGLVESSASQAFTTLKTLSARRVLSQPATSQ